MSAPRSVPQLARFAVAAAISLAAALALAQLFPPKLPPAEDAKPAPAGSTNTLPPSADCGQCGKVVSIHQTTVKEQWTPLGTATSFGTDARAATMFQIGPGLTNQGKVMVGAAGGAAYQKTPTSYDKPRWEVTVKLDSGQTRVMTLNYEPYVLEGDRVRISGRNVELIE
jgi:outer membrane lipoprotein SlyB